MAEHSPLPFSFDESGTITAANNTQVGKVKYLRDANLIVHCVNTNHKLVAALVQIAAIEDKEYGSDWEEIEEARKIANEAIASLKTE